MVETSLHQEFIADTFEEALTTGVAFADNRFDGIMKEMYKALCIGCIKIREKFIGRGQSSGMIDTAGTVPFFEWKCDYPGTRQNWIDKCKEELKEYNQQGILPILLDS